MGRGIDRNGPNGDYYISSTVTIVDHYTSSAIFDKDV